MTEQEYLASWVEYKVEHASTYTLPIYVGQFESMWLEQFGDLTSIPTELRNKITKRYKELNLAVP